METGGGATSVVAKSPLADVLVGCSGYNYKHWRGGAFYPISCTQREELRYYVGRRPFVEINSSFYGTPREETLAQWAHEARGNPHFRFTLKAPKAITHEARLGGDEAIQGARELFRRSHALRPFLGPVLFQTPPSLRRDDAKLTALLAAAPEGIQLAFEFRCRSWDAPEVTAALASHGAARVEVVPPWDHPTPEDKVRPMLRSASEMPRGARLSYIRMCHGEAAEGRGELSDFSQEQLTLLAQELDQRRKSETAAPIYVAFMNDLGARAPANARTLDEAIAAASGGVAPVQGVKSGGASLGGTGGKGIKEMFAAVAKKRQRECVDVDDDSVDGCGGKGGSVMRLDPPAREPTSLESGKVPATTSNKLLKAGPLDAFFARSGAKNKA